MLLFLSTTTYQIKLYFYNKKNSAVPSLYLFNEVNLLKNNNDFDFQFDVSHLNNTYNNGSCDHVNSAFAKINIYDEDNINMNKFNGHEAYIISEALDLYVKQINEEIEALEAEGKRSIFTIDYYPQVAKDIKTKLTFSTLKQNGNME